MQINGYHDGTKITTEVNERPLRNIGTYWNKASLISTSTNFLQPSLKRSVADVSSSISAPQ